MERRRRPFLSLQSVARSWHASAFFGFESRNQAVGRDINHNRKMEVNFYRLARRLLEFLPNLRPREQTYGSK